MTRAGKAGNRLNPRRNKKLSGRHVSMDAQIATAFLMTNVESRGMCYGYFLCARARGMSTTLLEVQEYENSQARVGYVHDVVRAMEWSQRLFQLLQRSARRRLSDVVPQRADVFE